MQRHFGLTLTMPPVTVLTLLAVAMGPAAQAQARLPYGPIPVDCDRACLEGLSVGDGFWGTATAIGGYRQVVADPVTGQVGFMGVARRAERE